jgi:hypothetical protein
MDLPKGEVTFSSKSPTVGTHKIKPRRASLSAHFIDDEVIYNEFSVSWSTQSSSREEWEREYLPFFMRSISQVVPRARVLRRGALDADRWFAVVGSDRVPLAVGVVRCDARFQVEFVFSRYHDVARQAALAERAVKSVRCEVTDENRAGLLPATRLPAGFGWLPTDFGQHFQSLSGETLMIDFTMGRIPPDADASRVALYAIFAAMDPEIPRSAVEYLRPPRGRDAGRERMMSRAPLTSGAGVIYVGSLFCPGEGASLMFIWTVPGAGEELAWKRLEQVGCPGEESVPVRRFAEVAADACAAGDTAACDARPLVD